jgi:hypothetical protein
MEQKSTIDNIHCQVYFTLHVLHVELIISVNHKVCLLSLMNLPFSDSTAWSWTKHLHVGNDDIPARQTFVLPPVCNGGEMFGTVSLRSTKVSWYVTTSNNLKIKQTFHKITYFLLSKTRRNGGHWSSLTEEYTFSVVAETAFFFFAIASIWTKCRFSVERLPSCNLF